MPTKLKNTKKNPTKTTLEKSVTAKVTRVKEREYVHTEDDIIAVGGDLSSDTLFKAYSRGIFPWPHERLPMLWFYPKQRGVILFKDLRIPKSLVKFKSKNKNLKFTINQNFEQVMKSCQMQKRPNQSGTWIIDAMVPAYSELQKRGFAISVEVWREKELIGGIYGVKIKNFFSAESMFYKESNASKLALWQLIEHLQKNGFTWIDIQMVTPVTEQFGGKYISLSEFERLLKSSKNKS